MKQHALARLDANRLARAERLVVDGINIGSALPGPGPRIQHRRPFRLRRAGIEIVGIHRLIGEVRLPIAQREIVFLIVVAGIGRALDDQKAELPGETAAMQVVHRHGVGVIPARAGGRGRELIAARSVRRARRACLLPPNRRHRRESAGRENARYSGTSVSLMTFTVTGTPSFMRSRGPGEVPL